MDLGFFDIFKNAKFNILMLSIATAGWILYVIGKVDDIFFVVTLICSLYCIYAFIVAVYKWGKEKYISIQKGKRIRRQQEQIDKDANQRLKILVHRMYYGLTEENRKLLKLLVSQGKQDSFYPNVRHYEATQDILNAIYHCEFTAQYQYGYDRIHCIEIEQHPADIIVTINPALIEIINEDENEQNQ